MKRILFGAALISIATISLCDDEIRYNVCNQMLNKRTLQLGRSETLQIPFGKCHSVTISEYQDTLGFLYALKGEWDQPDLIGEVLCYGVGEISVQRMDYDYDMKVINPNGECFPNGPCPTVNVISKPGT